MCRRAVLPLLLTMLTLSGNVFGQLGKMKFEQTIYQAIQKQFKASKKENKRFRRRRALAKKRHMAKINAEQDEAVKEILKLEWYVKRAQINGNIRKTAHVKRVCANFLKMSPQYRLMSFVKRQVDAKREREEAAKEAAEEAREAEEIAKAAKEAAQKARLKAVIAGVRAR